MWLTVFLKAFCELSLYYMTVGNLSLIIGGSENIILFPLILALCLLLSWVMRKNKILKYLSFLPAALCIPLFGGLIDAAVFAPALLLIVLTAAKNGYYTSHLRFYGFFTKGLIAIVPVVLFMVISSILRASIGTAVAFVIFYLFSGIFECRILRHEGAMANDRRFRALNIVIMAGISAGAFIFSRKEILAAIGKGLRFIYSWTIMPIMALFAYIGYGVSWLISKIKLEFTRYSSGYVNEVDGFQKLDPPEIKIVDPPDLRWIINILAIALFVLIVIFIIKKVKSSGEPAPAPTGETRSRLEAEKKSAEKFSLFPGTPRERIRKSYKKMMDLCEKSGASIENTLTTEEINSMAASVLEPEEKLLDLRSVYLKARYDMLAEPQKADAELAKECLKEIRRSK